MSAGLIIVWLLGRTLLAGAQTSNATCSVAQKWASNSQQQSPCLVASSLLAVCTGSYDVFALPEGWHYNGPSIQDANPCQCNTVVYSLLSECGLCQNRTVVMWSVWETNCASVSIGSFPKPIPAGLHVPGWAYVDVKATDMFNESLALANANITESTAIPQPSKTPIASSPTSSISSVAAQTTTASAPSSDADVVDQKRSNAIGGGIVGGFFGLVLVCSLAFWVHRRRAKAKANGEILNSPVMSQYRTDTLPSQPTIPVPSITVSSLNSQPGSGSIYSGQSV